jgi:hypothetical protein
MAMPRDLTLPPISEVPIGATVSAIHAAEGDFVRKNQPYMEIDAEKVSLEIPAPYDFFVLKVHVSLGQRIALGDKVLTVDPRDILSLCEIREQRSHIATGLKYLTTRTTELICYRAELGKYNFSDLEPFVSKILNLAREFSTEQIDSMSEATVVDLRDTFYRVTHLLTRLEGFDFRKMESDYWYLVRTVSDSQSELIRRLVRSAALVRGVTQDPEEELRQAGAIYNPGRAYAFLSHHHHDASVASQISERLYQAGIAHFLSEKSIAWGGEIPGAIHTALKRASHIVVIITPGAVRSAWVAYEVGFARGAEKIIIPYLQHLDVEIPHFMHNLRQLRGARDEALFIEDPQTYRRRP